MRKAKRAKGYEGLLFYPNGWYGRRVLPDFSFLVHGSFMEPVYTVFMNGLLFPSKFH